MLLNDFWTAYHQDFHLELLFSLTWRIHWIENGVGRNDGKSYALKNEFKNYYVDRVTDGCVRGRGFAARRVQLWIKFHLRFWCVHCVRTVTWLCYSFSDISLSVCLFMCVYTMLVALSMCLRVGAGIVGGSCEVPMIAIFLASRWVCR